MVLVEIQASRTHDFIELFNRGTPPVSLSGWSLQYASAIGTGNFDFILMISATSITEKITLRVVDIHGHVVELRVYSSANQTVKLGNQYHSGFYFVEILQGKEKKVLKLIKL